MVMHLEVIGPQGGRPVEMVQGLIVLAQLAKGGRRSVEGIEVKRVQGEALAKQCQGFRIAALLAG